MNENKLIITGIDIGTTKIIAVIAECYNDNIEILGIGESPSSGLKKGVIIDIIKTTESIKNAVSDAEKQSDIEIVDAFVGITGENIRGINCSGVVTVNKSSNRDAIGQEISEVDIQRVLDHAKSINLSYDRRILHTLTQEYTVDERTGIKNPLGLSGHRLEAKVHLITNAINTEKDLITSLNKANIDIVNFVLEPLASAYSVLDKNERELGAVLIDIGGGTTDIIVYKDGGVMHSGAIPIGGSNITNDIAYGIQTTVEQAEIIKCNYGCAKSSLAEVEEKINVSGTNGRDDFCISQKKLANIIEPRMNEIFQLAKNEMYKGNCEKDSTFGIVITGGGSQLLYLEDLALEIFQQPIKIGTPNIKGSLCESVNHPRFATAIGIIKYGLENWDKSEINDTVTLKSFFHEFLLKIKNNFNNWY